MEFKGVYTAMVTPFNGGRVDWDCLRQMTQMQIDGGVAGLVPVGTTGESPTLTYEEHARVIEEVVRIAAGRCLVIAGTGANSTAEAVEMTKHALAAGADATLQVTPYYNKPTQEGLYRHFSTVADEAGLPVVLYNVPGRAGVPIAVDTVARLSRNPMIVAIKEAAGSVERVSQLLDVCEIQVLSGDDALCLPMLSVGSRGVISVASNLFPREMVELCAAFFAGDIRKAQELHRKYYAFFRDQFVETNPIPIKEAMALAGLLRAEFRLPLCPLSDGNREKLAATMKKCGLL